MNFEETFHQLLGLDEGWRVISASYEEAENRFVIQVEETAKLWEQESARIGFPLNQLQHALFRD